MKLLTLTNGMQAKLDDEDYARCVAAGNWYADIHGHGDRIYVYRRFNRVKKYLHKFVLDYEGPLDIDHDDGDGLNCQKLNLLLKSRGQNNLNNHNIRSDNKCGVRGVYWDETHQRWKAEMKIKGKKFHLGSYWRIEDAATARQRAEAEYKATGTVTRPGR